MPAILNLRGQVDLVHQHIRPDLFHGPSTKYSADELRALFGRTDSPVFVCTDADGRVLGHCFCQFQQHISHPVLTDIKTLYIDDLCVDENCRGRHIGKTLYDPVLAFARENGCYNLTLNVWAGNDAAQRFYERCGLRTQKTGMELILR